MIGVPRNAFEFLVKYDDKSMLEDVLHDELPSKPVKTSINLGVEENAIVEVFQLPEVKNMLGSNRTEIISSLMRIGFDFIISTLDNDSVLVPITFEGKQMNVPMRHYLWASYHAKNRLAISEPDENVHDFQSALELYIRSWIALNEEKAK